MSQVLEMKSGQLTLLFNDSLTKQSPMRDFTNYIYIYIYIYICVCVCVCVCVCMCVCVCVHARANFILSFKYFMPEDDG